MKFWRFTVPGKLWGYRQGRKEAFRPDRVAFKDLVRMLATDKGIPCGADKRDNLFLEVRVCWKREARIDGPNVYKLIEDALWRQDRGVAGGLWIRHLKQPREEAVVQVYRDFVQPPICPMEWGD